MGESTGAISDSDDAGLKQLKITKRTQQQNNTKEIEDNTVSVPFSSPFSKHGISSRNSSRQTSRPSSKRSSKRISGFEILENISAAGVSHPVVSFSSTTKGSSAGEAHDIDRDAGANDGGSVDAGPKEEAGSETGHTGGEGAYLNQKGNSNNNNESGNIDNSNEGGHFDNNYTYNNINTNNTDNNNTPNDNNTTNNNNNTNNDNNDNESGNIDNKYNADNSGTIDSNADNSGNINTNNSTADNSGNIDNLGNDTPDDNSHETDNDNDASSADSFGWENMDAVANHTVYDESGKVQVADADLHHQTEGTVHIGNRSLSNTDTRKLNANTDSAAAESSDKNMFTYTKIDGEEQAKASRKTNAKIDSLIASATIYQRNSNRNQSAKPSSDTIADDSALDGDNGDTEDEESDTDITHDELTKNNQLSGMKQLLTDNEKFAYTGCVFLLLNQLCADLATRNLNSSMIKDQKLAKRLHSIQKSYGYWKQEIMSKLYYHMEFTEDEIRMIENLGLFPLEINDLMKALKIQRKVINPYSESFSEMENKEAKEEELKLSSMRSFNDSELTEKAPENIVSFEDIRHETELEVDVPWSVICDLFLLFLSKGNYDARSRVVLKEFAEFLNISHEEVNQFEKRITETLELEQSDQQRLSREDLLKKRRKHRKRKKMAYVGLATVGGSLVLGLSGGLLAPVIGAGVAAGLSTVGITGFSGFLTGVGGTATVAATSTAIGANIGGSSMSRRMGSVKTFEFKPLYNNRRLNLIISVSGWMTGAEDDVRLPFSTLDPVEGDLYSLNWEPDILKSTGDTMNILASEAITQTIQQVLGATILTAFMGAIQLPMALSKLGYLIDNPWNVSLDRAWNTGLILAQYLIEKDLGDRPITLVGFSLGSRVIYYCLKELCKRGATGIIENVVILGSPVVYDKDEMVMCRSVVAGRFVNGYSEKDWILGYLFRATAGGIATVAGLSPIDSDGIENFDCSDLVNGHMGYRKNIPKIMKQLGFSTLSDEFVEIDDKPDPNRERKQKELLATLKKLEKDEKKKSSSSSSSWIPRWMKPKKEEWQEMVKKDIITDEKETKEAPEYTPEVGIVKPETETDIAKTENEVDVKPKLDKLSSLNLNSNTAAETSSPVSQQGETFSLQLSKMRPRFASGNVGFVLKNAGRSRNVSEISKAVDGEVNIEKENVVQKENETSSKDDSVLQRKDSVIKKTADADTLPQVLSENMPAQSILSSKETGKKDSCAANEGETEAEGTFTAVADISEVDSSKEAVSKKENEGLGLIHLDSKPVQKSDSAEKETHPRFSIESVFVTADEDNEPNRLLNTERSRNEIVVANISVDEDSSENKNGNEQVMLAGDETITAENASDDAFEKETLPAQPVSADVLNNNDEPLGLPDNNCDNAAESSSIRSTSSNTNKNQEELETLPAEKIEKLTTEKVEALPAEKIEKLTAEKVEALQSENLNHENETETGRISIDSTVSTRSTNSKKARKKKNKKRK